MLSILIPVYNQYPEQLVRSLEIQIRNLRENIELILMDDGSDYQYRKINRSISWPAFLQYIENEKNIGRAAIRNKLAQRAQFPYLLFLDGDSKIVKDDFLKVYIHHLFKDRVLTGGRTYPGECPSKKYQLHWSYGKFREGSEKGAFQSNNFLISSEVFFKIQFDEQLNSYGHEDTVFGYQLEQNNIAVHFLENPVLHAELQDANTFLNNQENAIKNLKIIARSFPDLETTLLKTAKKLKKWRIAPLVKISSGILLPFLSYSLKRINWLWMLDLYKIILLLSPDKIRK